MAVSYVWTIAGGTGAGGIVLGVVWARAGQRAVLEESAPLIHLNTFSRTV